MIKCLAKVKNKHKIESIEYLLREKDFNKDILERESRENCTKKRKKKLAYKTTGYYFYGLMKVSRMNILCRVKSNTSKKFYYSCQADQICVPTVPICQIM